MLKASDFRKVYNEGSRMASPYFAAFCLRVARDEGGPRLGFTLPRAFGKAVYRNRVKRRMREILRLRLAEIGPHWDIVINPRRAALDATVEELGRQLDRLIKQCGKS